MPYMSLQQQQQHFFFENWINIQLITLLSQPQIAYELIKVGEAEDILQVQGLSIDGLNNSKDTTRQKIQ